MSNLSAAPRLDLLGQVALSNAPAPLPGRAIEFLTYVHLHPGVNGEQIQAALWPHKFDPAANDTKILAHRIRQALGNDPDGNPWLPCATKSAGYTLHPAFTSDWAQFQALMAPTPHHAPTTALTSAIRLVRGQPLDGITRRRGWWEWRDTHEEAMIAAVLEAATELTTRAVAIGNYSGARTASRIARATDPLNETGWQLEIIAAHTQPDRLHTIEHDLYATVGKPNTLDAKTRALIALAHT